MTPHQRLVEHLAASTLDAEDEAHASRCPACAALRSAGVPEADGQPVLSELLAAAHRELGRPWWLLATGLGVANALLAVASVSVLEPWNWGVSTSPRWLFLTVAALLGALATGGTLIALAPGRGWPKASLALLALAPLAVLLGADGRAANSHFLEGASCLLTVVVLSALPLAGGAWLLMQSAYSPQRALAVGLVSAAVGLLVLQFHCADGASSHLLVFHLLPWAALGGAAILLRRRLPTASHAP